LSFKIVRHAQARIALGSGAFEGPFTLKARIEEGVHSPNPEELLGAAHAACFTMSLANTLSEQGHPPADLQTTARVVLEQLEQGFSITGIELQTEARVEGIDEQTFLDLAEQAKATCPVSRALAATEITLTATLVSG
jgi:osmotically inducible protein OsmC